MGWLKQLTTSEQVALLFVVLFGFLLLLTVALFLNSLRDRPLEDPRHPSRLSWERVRPDLRAAWIGGCMFWAAWISGPLGATALFALCSFLALREFITMLHTQRSDHRTLIVAFFGLLPVQYLICGTRFFDLFTVFLPVYGFLVLPIVSALADDPTRFLERNAKIQWGVMVCVYGLSHTPALLLLDFPGYTGRGAFLLFFLVMVMSIAQIAQEIARRTMRRRPVARRISRSFSMRAWWIGTLAGGLTGGLLYWITPFKAGQAFAMALLAAGAGGFGGLVMRALKKDAGMRSWGNRSSITGAVGLLDRIAVLCFAAPVFFHSVRWYFQLPLGSR
ncbi:MAG: phosphatidate cytidylyltransferase [Roseateles depolymerans]|uniref:Phosphatidate cytidylyltransferase n=1 Tax=Roseateles depolymerans TaxID=76731 RepID=A0A2W5E166_9BURK|nr:MAG: phosphatidate cytidylyltransferase [Roseateles depolymerans]